MTKTPASHPARERGEATRARLVEATVTVGVDEGWGGVTTRAVAAEAGVPSGLVHYHFGSIEELRRAAVRHVVGALLAESLAALEAVTDPADAVRAMVRTVAAGGDEDRLSVFLYEAVLAARRDESLRSELAEVLRLSRDGLAGWIRAVTARQRHPVDPDAAALLLGAALDGVYLHRLLDDRVDPAALAEPVARLLRPPRRS